MHIRPKTSEEIEIMRQGGAILNDILKATYTYVKPGQTLREIDKFIHHLIIQAGAKPSFFGYHGFPASACLSVNSAVVHGIPNDYVLKDGDLLGVDVGVLFEGYHTDSAFTMPIGSVTPEAAKLLAVTQESLKVALEAAVAGNMVQDIGIAIENYVKSQGKYGIIRDLSGHGIGQKLQEAPEILNFKTKNTTPLINGMTLAIEPMISLGTHQVEIDSDNWTVRTKDNSATAHFESTIVIHENDPIVLVPFALHMQLTTRPATPKGLV